jgi:hypothetical protein
MTEVQSGFETPLDSDIFADDAGEGGGPTVLDELEHALSVKVANEDKEIRVPGRPGVTLMCDANIDSEVLGTWRKKSKDKRDVDGYNAKRFACIVIANQTKTVLWKGEPKNGRDGRALNFKHMQLLDMMGMPFAVEAVSTMFSNDGQLIQAANSVLEAAGYAEEDMGVDSDPI